MSGEGWGLGICLLIIAFYGEPDLVGTLIKFFGG